MAVGSDLNVQIAELRQQVEMIRVRLRMEAEDLGKQVESAREATRSKVAELGRRLEDKLHVLVRESVRQEVTCFGQRLQQDLEESQRTDNRVVAMDKSITAVGQEVNRLKEMFSRDLFSLQERLQSMQQNVSQDMVLMATRTSTTRSSTSVVGTMEPPIACGLPTESVRTTIPRDDSYSSIRSMSHASVSDHKADSTTEAGTHSDGSLASPGLQDMVRQFYHGAWPPSPGDAPSQACESAISSQVACSLLLNSALRPTGRNGMAQLLSVVDCELDDLVDENVTSAHSMSKREPRKQQ